MKTRGWQLIIELLILAACGIALQVGRLSSRAASESGGSADLTYPVVDTGQATCYDEGAPIPCPEEGEAFYGQDAQVAGHAPAYTDNGDGTVTDEVTGLTWTQSPDLDGSGEIDAGDKLAYAAAVGYCDALTFAGYDDWRLPTIKQLYSLMDFRGTDPMGPGAADPAPFIDTGYFAFAYGDVGAGERLIDAQYASGTLYTGAVFNGREAMFGLNLADGRIKGYPSDKAFYVLCARGNPAYGENDFVDNGDGTVTDAATGLTWAQGDSGVGMDWEGALAYVEGKNAENYLGYGDWRLPNAKELQSIVDYSRSPDATGSAAIDPLFNATGITNLAGETDYPYYWSSTTHARADGSGMNGAYVAFGRGLGSMDGSAIMDVHGAGCQRSDPKAGDPADYPVVGIGPQGDVQRVFNYVRLVRGGTSGGAVTDEATQERDQPAQSEPGTPLHGEGEMRQPPQEAFAACEGLSLGAACTVHTPDGRQIAGTCAAPQGELICVPEGGPPAPP